MSEYFRKRLTERGNVPEFSQRGHMDAGPYTGSAGRKVGPGDGDDQY